MGKRATTKSEYLKLCIDTRKGAKHAQKNIDKIGTILKKVLPPKDFAEFGEPQVRRLEELADAFLHEADQLHDLWLKKKE